LTKASAEIWLSRTETEILDGAWIDPAASRVRFGVYASDWIRDRVLKPRTAELYRGLLANHLEQSFGSLNVSSIREANVRRWRKERLDSGQDASPPFGPVTVAKA